MGFETYQNIAKQKLDSLQKDGLESTVLDQIDAFITSSEARPAIKAVQHYDDLQLWWTGENERSNEYDHVCLTFALKGLTVSLEHMHTDNHFPLFPHETSANNYTLLIKPTVSPQEADAMRSVDPFPSFNSEGGYIPPRTFISLHQANTLRAGSVGPQYGNEALQIFQPRLDHTFHMLGFRAKELTDLVVTPIEIAS